MDIVAKRLVQLRAERGETQTAVAKVLHITNPAVCCWENGRRHYPLWAVIELCKHYGVSADWVLGLSEERERRWS